MASSTIEVQGHTDERGDDAYNNEAAYRKNRRVDFVLRKRTED